MRIYATYSSFNAAINLQNQIIKQILQVIMQHNKSNLKNNLKDLKKSDEIRLYILTGIFSLFSALCYIIR